jgi:o-succinylbenzoate synthase
LQRRRGSKCCQERDAGNDDLVSKEMTAVDIAKQLVRVKSVALHRVRVPLVEPFRISNGEVSEKEAILIEVASVAGKHTGWGEASPMPGNFYSGDTPDTVWDSLVRDLVPPLLSDGEIDVPQFYKKLRRKGSDQFAKSGIEGALWDLYANTVNAPLCELFGGSSRPIPSGVAIGIYDELEELLDRVQRFVAQGYRRVKIKIAPGWDIEPVRAIRQRHPELRLMVDANAAYSIEDLNIFRELDTCDLMMIEQPFAGDAHAEAAELQRQVRTPLCADESAESLETLSSLIEKQAAQIINIKVQRVGGLSEAILMLHAARAAGLECWVGTMPELGVASVQGLHFASLDAFSYPTDIEASLRWYVDDVIEPAIEIDDQGWIHLPEGPGSGYRVDREKIARYAIETMEFEN